MNNSNNNEDNENTQIEKNEKIKNQNFDDMPLPTLILIIYP